MVFLLRHEDRLSRVVETWVNGSRMHGLLRGLNLLTVIDDLINQCLALGERSMKSVVVELPRILLGRSCVGAPYPLNPGHYNDQIF